MSLGVAVGHVLRFWRIPDRVIDRINPVCLPFTIAGPATFGSAMTFWIIGTMGLCLARTLSGAMAVTRRREARIVSLLLAMWFVLHAVFGVAHSRSNETFRQIVETLPFIGMLPLYAGLALTRPEKLIGPTGFAVAAGALGALAVATFDIANGLPRAEGIAGNPGPFGAMSLLLLGYCLVSAINGERQMRLLAGVGALAATVCVILSGMRALWPGLLLLPLFIGFIYRRDLKSVANWRTISLAVFAITVVSVSTIQVIEQRSAILLTELSTLNDNLDLTRSLDQHIALWTAGVTLFADAPLSGHGLEIGPLMLEEMQRIFGEGFTLTHFHNAVIDIGVKTGITGIALLAAMVILPLVYCARRRTTVAGRFGFAMMVVLMTTYCLAGLSGLMLGHDIMDSVFIFSVAYWCMFAFESEAQHD